MAFKLRTVNDTGAPKMHEGTVHTPGVGGYTANHDGTYTRQEAVTGYSKRNRRQSKVAAENLYNRAQNDENSSASTRSNRGNIFTKYKTKGGSSSSSSSFASEGTSNKSISERDIRKMINKTGSATIKDGKLTTGTNETTTRRISKKQYGYLVKKDNKKKSNETRRLKIQADNVARVNASKLRKAAKKKSNAARRLKIQTANVARVNESKLRKAAKLAERKAKFDARNKKK